MPSHGSEFFDSFIIGLVRKRSRRRSLIQWNHEDLIFDLVRLEFPPASESMFLADAGDQSLAVSGELERVDETRCIHCHQRRQRAESVATLPQAD